jgi:hypothetical protein
MKVLPLLLLWISFSTATHAHRSDWATCDGGNTPFIPKTRLVCKANPSLCHDASRNTQRQSVLDHDMAILQRIIQLPRGGSGILDPELTVKLLSLVVGLQGLVMNTGSKISNECMALQAKTTMIWLSFSEDNLELEFCPPASFWAVCILERLRLQVPIKHFLLSASIKQYANGLANLQRM